jgi:hypothetical protein
MSNQRHFKQIQFPGNTGLHTTATRPASPMLGLPTVVLVDCH